MKWTLLLILIAATGTAFGQEKPNPFAGTTAAFEQRLRLLEERKLDAAIANEELAAEKANQERLRIRAGRPLGLSEAALVEVPKAGPARRVPQAMTAPELPAASSSTKSKVPRLVGTVSAPAGWVALVESGDKILNVPEGSVVDGVRAAGITRDKATINGVPMVLENVVARVAVPLPSTPNAGPRVVNPSGAPSETMDLALPAFRK